MKKTFTMMTLLFLTNSYAFDSGLYECKFFDFKETIKVLLKDNGRAKVTYFGKTERGNWFDDDDAAIVFDDYVLEKHKDKYTFTMDSDDPYATMSCVKK